MKIAVLGTGNIGGTLGRAFAKAGHEVRFGSHRPDDDTVAAGSGAVVTDVAGSLEDAEVVVIAVPGSAVSAVVGEHATALAGRLLIDAANIMGSAVANSRIPIHDAVPTARYARAFNSLGVESLRDPAFGEACADMFFSAPEADEHVVADLVTAVGLRPFYLGDDAQELVDGVLRLWFALSRRRGRHLALTVLDRSAARW